MKTKYFLLILGIIGVFIMSIEPVSANVGGKTDDYFVDVAGKLGRGVGDVISSPAEFPCGMLDHSIDKGMPGVFAGLGQGAVKMVRRLGFGVFEIGTFFVPTEYVMAPPCRESED